MALLDPRTGEFKTGHDGWLAYFCFHGMHDQAIEHLQKLERNQASKELNYCNPVAAPGAGDGGGPGGVEGGGQAEGQAVLLHEGPAAAVGPPGLRAGPGAAAVRSGSLRRRGGVEGERMNCK